MPYLSPASISAFNFEIMLGIFCNVCLKKQGLCINQQFPTWGQKDDIINRNNCRKGGFRDKIAGFNVVEIGLEIIFFPVYAIDGLFDLDSVTSVFCLSFFICKIIVLKWTSSVAPKFSQSVIYEWSVIIFNGHMVYCFPFVSNHLIPMSQLHWHGQILKDNQ